jgi:glucose uptake protein
MVLGAVWALAVKAVGKWRFELLGIDFGLGVILSALAIGFTLGTMGDEITFFDNLMIMRKSSLGFLVGFGALLNLGMLLLLAAVSVGGVAVTFLTGMSMAAVISAVGMHMVQPLMSPIYLIIGTVLLLAGLAMAAMAHISRIRQRETDLLQKAVAAGIKGKLPKVSPAKALILAVAGGLLTGLAQPIALFLQSRDEIGFGAYSMGALFAGAFVVGTPFFSLFFLNLPVQGEALSFGEWLKGTVKQHLLGLASGAVWYAGLIALLLAVTATPAAGVGRSTAFALTRGSIILGAIAGILINAEMPYAAARKQAWIALAAATAGLVVFAAGRP